MVAAVSRRKVLPVPFYQQQADFLSSRAWMRGFVGGRGTGKTFVGSHVVRKEAKHKEPWLAVSPDAGVAMETTYPSFLEMTEALGIFVQTKLTPYPKIWFRTHDHGVASILFRSAEKPEKLRGGNYAGVWFDEASFQPFESFERTIATLRWKGLMGPCLLTFTPKGRTNWTFDRFFTPVDERLIGTADYPPESIDWIQGRPYQRIENRHLVHARSSDNPFLPPDYVHNISGNYSSRFAQQELGGEFLDIAGLMFERHWFKFVDEAPRDAMRVRYWDKASTPGAGCYTAGILMAKAEKGWFVEDAIRGQWSPLERDRVIRQTAEADERKYHGEVIIVAEQEGGSAGKEIAHQMITSMAGFPVFRDLPTGGGQRRTVDGHVLPGEAKIRRALGWCAQAEAGNIHLVRGAWNADWLEEVVAFPESSFLDQVDATSGAFNRLEGRMFAAQPAPEKSRVEAPINNNVGAGSALERARFRRLYGHSKTR